MKLRHFRIKNIKSIIDSRTCHIAGDNITVFAGQNESGKSAILEALNYFSKGVDDKFKQYSTRIDKSIPYVECCFALCDETDCDYKDENTGIVLETLKEISCFREGENPIKFCSDTNEKLKEIISQLAKKGKISNIKQEETENTEEDNSDEKVTVEEFVEEIEQSVMKYIPTFDYYDSFEDKLPEKIAIEDIEQDNAVKDFQLVFNIKFAEYIEKSYREKEFDKQNVEERLKIDFNECWTQKLTDEDNNSYNFRIKDEDNTIIFLIDRDNKVPLFLTQKSKGFQWFLSFYLRLKALKTKMERRDIEDYILLIDEPGQGLHEKAQEDVKKVLEELAGNGIQILYTTHNPRLIEVGDKITRLRLVYQDKVEGTKINTLPQMASKGTKQSQDALSPIVTAMGLINISCMDLSHNKNVIVEGITDKYYLEAFAKLLNIRLDYNIIPSCGCENIKNIASILLGWGYSFKVIIDKGEGQNPQEDITQKIIREKLLTYNEDLETKVVKRLSHVAIEDVFSKNDFRRYVKPEDVVHNNKNNVKLAKEYGKKELWARLFIEKINTKQLAYSDFEQETLDNFREIINWIQSN